MLCEPPSMASLCIPHLEVQNIPLKRRRLRRRDSLAGLRLEGSLCSRPKGLRRSRPVAGLLTKSSAFLHLVPLLREGWGGGGQVAPLRSPLRSPQGARKDSHVRGLPGPKLGSAGGSYGEAVPTRARVLPPGLSWATCVPHALGVSTWETLPMGLPPPLCLPTEEGPAWDSTSEP